MPKYIFLILVLVTAYGCKKENGVKQELPVVSKTDSVKDVNEPDIFEGIYTTNRNESTFLDCSNSNSKYWVIDETNNLSGQYVKMFEIPSVYNSVVAKVKGEIEVTDNVTIAEKFPKTLRVKEVISVEKKNFRNTCVTYDYWAFGNEPNWSLQISKKENLIEFNLPGQSKSYYFFYSEPILENGFIVYRNHNPIQRYLIEIRIKKEPCRDTTSGTAYEYSVEVDLPGNLKFKGCGMKGKQ